MLYYGHTEFKKIGVSFQQGGKKSRFNTRPKI
jgi:hypothetical protein